MSLRGQIHILLADTSEWVMVGFSVATRVSGNAVAPWRHGQMKLALTRAFLLVILVWAGFAQSAQSPDLNELKGKLQQLEQMMQDLKQQIATAEAAQQTPGQPLVTKVPQPKGSS